MVRAICSDGNLGFQQSKQHLFPIALLIWAMQEPILVQNQGTVHAAEIALAPIVLDIEVFVPEMGKRQHPFLFLVVLDHRLHRLVLLDKRADKAPKPTVAAAWGAGVHHKRTFVIGRGAPIDI